MDKLRVQELHDLAEDFLRLCYKSVRSPLSDQEWEELNAAQTRFLTALGLTKGPDGLWRKEEGDAS